ncbi:c-type cytochrome, partial [bacterium]|nr:c-type cytochrome [bacterium]
MTSAAQITTQRPRATAASQCDLRSRSCAWITKFAFCTFALLAVFAVDAHAADGKATYMQQCASCHGDQGQGVQNEYPESLIGDWSVVELTEYITKRMPEGEPDKCVGDDAQAVAGW